MSRYDPLHEPPVSAGGIAVPRTFSPLDPKAKPLAISPTLNRMIAASARRTGNAARDRRDWAAAAAAYRRYLTYDPGCFAIRVQLGHMLKESGDRAAAAAMYDEALQIDPRNSDLLIWIGDLHRREGRLEAALEAFQASYAIDGNAGAGRDIADVLAVLRAREEQEPQAAPEAALEAEAEPVPEASIYPGMTPELEVHEKVFREPRWVGHIDSVRGAIVTGWAVDPDFPGEPVQIEFLAGDRLVGTALANTQREDLATIGGLGYRTHLDLAGLDESSWIDARLRRTGEPLRDAPFRVQVQAREHDAPLASSVRVEIVKPLEFAAGEELALFVTHSRTGMVKPHLLAHVQALRGQGIKTLLIVVADRPVDIADAVLDMVAGAMVRENRGYDFACWAHAIHLHPEVYGASLLYLVNDSVYGPADPDRFARMIDRVRASTADLVGLTESHEYRWHVQSYFLALKPTLLTWLPLHRYVKDVRILGNKDEVIQRYELDFSGMVEAHGMKVDVLFPSHTARNPTLFGWKELLDSDFPYVKMLLLHGAFPMIDTTGWRRVVARHGFDLPLLERTLDVAAEKWEPEPGHALLARPNRRRPAAAKPLKIAFFGPWNYDNGLSAASRGLIAALRRCDVRLNIYPIEKSFHVHRPLAPPVAITDFTGPADIAIVHMNPDSWHLLTDDQRALIAAAGKRIGHWVWEMAHIPPAWRHNFSSVDRIWAPSGYCADLFAGEGEAPVDVVPYTVPLPETRLTPEDKERLRESFGVPARNRVILYAFDGSSYLVRKNPMALVRAFRASGLAATGWSLVLKTKHLFDRAEEGRALEALAKGTPGVRLINASMPAGEMANLAALCDIYASTHCSEGFGLTIAEAMAAGKPVIATDFGGSTQFLDASCGYPVKAHAWMLEDDFGHYTKGGEWARIDEPALAATLVAAARAIDNGDNRVGEAARARVAETLSYEAIGRLMVASFRSVMTDETPISRPVPRIVPDLALGTRFDQVDLGTRLVPLALGEDLSPPPIGALTGLPDDRDHWIVLAPANALVAPLFARTVEEFVDARPGADIVYTDDIASGERNGLNQLRLKPAFDVTLLCAQDYIGAPLIVRASAFARLNGFDRRAGAAALNDLLFRAHALGMAIVPLHETLLASEGPRPVPSRGVRRAMLQRLPAFAGHDIVDGLLPDTLELRRRFTDADTPAVTIVIPTRRSPLPGGTGTYVERLLRRLGEVDWPMDRLHVLIGDDVDDAPAWETARYPFSLTRIATPRADGEPFNYSAKMNRLWRLVETEHMVLMNDDVAPIGCGWLRALMTFAADESVGGVGARLLYENGRMQHAGMAPLFGLVAHAWINQPRGGAGYQGWAKVQREWSMVTGAVFATRRAMLEQVGGFEERFSLEYNDVDLCLRMRALGYRIVCTPHAEMHHAEKASRGQRPPPGQDLALFLERWGKWLRSDPAFHPKLRQDSVTIEPSVDPNAWYA